MSATSEYDAYSYAKFLVDIYPEDAIDILCQRDPVDIIKLVEQRVDRACIKLGGGSKNEVKGMVETRRWDELQARKESGTSATTTTVTYRGADARTMLPATPSSMSSRSPHSQRIPSYEWIYIYHTGEPVQLTARPSGSEEFMIGEDKLEHFQGLAVDWISPSKRITLGGRSIEVAKNIHLTWSRPGEMGTDYQQFWVIDPEMIRHADVLLGQKRHRSRRGDDKGAMSSPLSLDPQGSRIPPPAPTPRQHHGLHERTSSTAIYSVHDSPTYGKGHASSHHDMAMSSHHPLRPPGRTATMNSGPPSLHNPPSSHPPSIIDEAPSRPHSASSTRTSKSSKSDTVVVQLCFGTSKRILRLDLTINGDQIIPFLESHISKMSTSQLDRVNHEINIIPLQTSNPESQGSSLSEEEFDDDIWGAMVEFMLEHRPKIASKKPEFQLDIG